MLKGLRKKASILSLTQAPPPAPLDPSKQDASNYLKILNQVSDFEIALKAMDYLLDDRTEEGVKLLKASSENQKVNRPEQPSSMFVLALGVMEFIEATLGFEPEKIEKAHKTLTISESASVSNVKYNTKHQLSTSNIYPPGTELQVINAESTLLNALLMLLTENNGVIESAKALFKLRKAYQTLDSIYKTVKESEPVFNRNLEKLKNAAAADPKSLSSVDLPGFQTEKLHESSSSLPEDLKLIKELEKVYQMRKSRIEGTNLGNHHLSQVDLFKNDDLPNGKSSRKSSQYLDKVNHLPGSDSEFTSPSDSGVSSPRIPQSLKSNKSSGRSSPKLSTPVTAGRQPSPRPSVQNSQFARDIIDSEDDDEFADAMDELSDPVDFKHSSQNASKTNNNSSPATSNAFGYDQSQSANSTESVSQDIGLGKNENSFPSTSSSILSTPSNSTRSTPPDNHLHVSTVDEFIHSGVQLCFGILQVVLSLIPPAIGKVLSIVGFKGDKEAGLKMLWRTAITSRNIHGELAFLFLLIFYDGPIQFIDFGYQLPGQDDKNVKDVINIEQKSSISDQELDKVLSNPILYTPQLLARARKFFPHNALWILQEGRTLAGQGKLAQAIQTMQSFTDNPDNVIHMQQIEALLVFDRAMLYVFYHDYVQAARDFVHLIDINSWSKGVYLFMAASCYLEHYRMIKMGLVEVPEASRAEELQKYADLAKTYFDLAPTYVPGHGVNATAKKGGLGGSGKQMPFDKFLLRKLKHIETCQKYHPDLPFIDCIGTSIIHELMYFWNGYNRMTSRELNLTLKLLGYSGRKGCRYSANTNSVTYTKIEETVDEAMIRYFLQAITLRSLGQVSEGLSLLDTEVISKYVISDYPQFKFTKLTHSPYLYPTALGEKAMFVWILRTSVNGELNVKQVVSECKNWLKKGNEVGEGDYELSNRTGMRLKAAVDRLDDIASKS